MDEPAPRWYVERLLEERDKRDHERATAQQRAIDAALDAARAAHRNTTESWRTVILVAAFAVSLAALILAAVR